MTRLDQAKRESYLHDKHLDPHNGQYYLRSKHACTYLRLRVAGCLSVCPFVRLTVSSFSFFCAHIMQTGCAKTIDRFKTDNISLLVSRACKPRSPVEKLPQLKRKRLLQSRFDPPPVTEWRRICRAYVCLLMWTEAKGNEYK